jgi:glycosyltransferase involved in cell wall biosynthesis
MQNALIYDASRLITRTLNATPNGIDRIDVLLARGMLSHPDIHLLRFGFRGPAIFPGEDFPDPVRRVEAAWREAAPGPDDLKLLRTLRNRLLGRNDAARTGGRGAPLAKLRRRICSPLRSFISYAGLKGKCPVEAAPERAIYVNATHFPMEWRSHVAWLDERPDIRLVPFIHDLLPIERPELFWGAEPQRHRKRLALLARRGAAVLVTSRHVEDALTAHMRREGRPDLPVFRASPPVAAEFFSLPLCDRALKEACYFVVCGTIEPRKNHLLLVDVWRRLTRAFGPKAPRLLVIGKRGWKCDRIFSEIFSEDLRSSVIVVSGLPTSTYKVVLAHAVALLAPALAEGLGLSIGEAMALGVPVIASDIDGHREYPADSMLLLDPGKPERWMAAIVDAAKTRPVAPIAHDYVQSNTEENYFRKFNRFLATLP